MSAHMQDEYVVYITERENKMLRDTYYTLNMEAMFESTWT